MRTYRIAVFVSGPGANFRSILDTTDRRDSQSKVLPCHSNKEGACGLERAKKHGIDCLVFRDDDEILQALESRGIDLTALAGYLRVLSDYFLEDSKSLILGIHPSLLPKYEGMGICGVHVHEVVYTHGERESGATVHLVTGVMDGGQIIFQESTEIGGCRSLEEAQARVLKVERRLLPEAIAHLEEV